MSDQAPEDGLYVNGELVTWKDLTFKEQREFRDTVRDLAPDGELGESSDVDHIPAFIYVVAKRSNPDFTIEDALAMKADDVAPPPKPAKRAAKAKAA